uniref:Putative bitil peptide n=1 Tax=Rhipicephalus pulchellus TaxID=72859 RepID=L7LQZ0_RHIPC
MHCTTIIVAAIFCKFVSGQEYAGSPQCGCLEVPATSSRQRDKFCRPHMTIASERHKHRNCVCRPGLVRNSWGDCITKQECTSCKCFRDRDFNVCGRECPLICNEPISRSCSKSCAFGCDCLPGFVRNARFRSRCVKAAKCGFTCPQFSSFQFCSSTCAPKCGRHPRGSCVTRCTRGDCVCNQGYAEVEHNGETICVPQEQCSRYIQVAPPMTPGGHGNISSGGSVFVPGTPTIPVNPGVVTGGTAGTRVTGSVGISGSLGGGVSSGGSVPSTIPVHPGAVSGGAAGTPVPGSIGINGNLGGGVSPGGSAPGTMPAHPGVLSGGAAGRPIPGSAGINGNLGGGVSSGGSVPGTIPVYPGAVSGGSAGTPVPGSIGINGNQGGAGSSGGPVFVPGTIPGHPGVGTGGAVGPSPPRSVGSGGSSHMQSVPAGGTGSIVTIVGGGSQPGQFGTSHVLPVPGANGGVSVGTYPQGVPPRQPGSIDAQGRPSIGTNGFGSVGGGLFTGSIRPNDSKESGEGTGVDATGIPQAPGVIRPVGAPAAAGTTMPNSNFGVGSVGGGLGPVIIPPSYVPTPGPATGVGTAGSLHGSPETPFSARPGLASSTVPPGTMQPPYTATPGSAAGMGTGGSAYGTTGLAVPHKPGTNIASVHSAGTTVMRPSGIPIGLTPTPSQSTPESPSVHSGGVPLPSSTFPVGVGLPSNGLAGNETPVPGLSGITIGSTPSTVSGSTQPAVGIHVTGGPFKVITAPGVAGNGVVITSTPQVATTHPSGSATIGGPGSLIVAAGGGPTMPATGTISISTSPSDVSGSGVSPGYSGVVGGTGTLHTGMIPSTGVTAPSTVTGSVFSTITPSSITSSGGTAGVAGGGSGFGVNGEPHGVSVGNSPVITGLGASSGIPAVTAAAITSAASARIPANPTFMTGPRALEGTGSGNPGQHIAP